MRTDERRKNGLPSGRRLQGLLLILLVATVPVSAAAAERVSAGEALTAKERATDLRSELQSLDGRGEVDVDEDVLATVGREIEKGKLAVDSGEYTDAKSHFDRAAVQARAELTRSYAEGAKTLLDGSDSYLNSLRQQGYATTEIGVLRKRISKQRQRLGNADDLGSARNVYADARSIQDDTKDLPQPSVVRAVGLLTSVWSLLLVALLLAAAVVGWHVRTNDHGNDGPRLH